MGREQVRARRVADDALRVLGAQIREGRANRKWTQAHLGGIAGVSQRTVSLIERGEPSVAIGNVLNVAVAVGVPLFQVDDPDELARIRHRGEERLALIPKRIVDRAVRDASLDF